MPQACGNCLVLYFRSKHINTFLYVYPTIKTLISTRFKSVIENFPLSRSLFDFFVFLCFSFVLHTGGLVTISCLQEGKDVNEITSSRTVRRGTCQHRPRHQVLPNINSGRFLMNLLVRLDIRQFSGLSNIHRQSRVPENP